MALLELARRKRFAIVEDYYDHEFHFEGRPVLPLASGDELPALEEQQDLLLQLVNVVARAKQVDRAIEGDRQSTDR